MWTEVRNQEALVAALSLARGRYQRALHNGQGYTITKSRRVGCYIWHIHKASTAPAFSSQQSEAVYTIDSDGCNCPDATTARAGLCKHKLATMLVVEMEKEA